MNPAELWGRVRTRWPQIRATALQDLGAICIGTAAVFLTRAFPSARIEDFGWVMLSASAAFAIIGIGLRVWAKL